LAINTGTSFFESEALNFARTVVTGIAASYLNLGEKLMAPITRQNPTATFT